MLIKRNLKTQIIAKSTNCTPPSIKSLNAFFIKIMLMCLATCFMFKTGSAKKQTDYGRIYNVQDYIDSAPSGLSLTKETIGFRRCFTTVMEKIYKYCETSDTDKVFTILVPLNTGISNTIVPYNINDKLVAVRINGSNVWFRPDTNYQTKITINIIGLSINDSTLKSKMSTYLNATETEQSSFYSGNIYNQSFYLSDSDPNNLGLNYNINGLQSNTFFNSYLDTVLVDIDMVHGTNPADTNFLSYDTSTIMPIIQSFNPDAHNFIYLKTMGKNDTDAYIFPPDIKNPNDLPNTEINICGLKLEGINQTNNSVVYVDTSQQHNFQFKMGTGVNIENFKRVFVDNMILENFYGNGISINNRYYAYINDSVCVNKNVIKNVWGLKYKQVCNSGKISYDDTGDGIRFVGIDSGISNMNYIKNDLSYTKQFGRIGLASCSEHNRNTIAEYNYIHGYDRNIHSENNLSGFKIRYNRITGSETGIVFDGNRNYTSSHFCPAANKSEISYNYISNEGIVYNAELQKIYPPHLFFSPGAHRSNEYYGTEIKNNEFVLDKANSGFQYSNNVAPVIMPNCTSVNQLATNPRPYSSSFSINNTNKYHLYSGIRAQKITCNLFNTINSMNTGYSIGGVVMRSFCPNEITGVDASCGLYLNVSVSLTPCTNVQLDTSSIPIEFKGNILINCNEINILHPDSSYETQGLFPNYFVNNDSTSITSNINIDSFIKAPILNPYNCNTQYNIPFLFANISAQNPTCTNPSNSGKISLTSVGGIGTVTYSIAPNLGNQLTPGNFVNLPAYIYTIVATDSNATSISTIVEITSPLLGDFCSCAYGIALVNTPNIILKVAPTASSLIALYGSIISGKVFYIDSILTIDTSINFENCSFWFTPSGQIVLSGPNTLNLAKCKLQAACDIWQGIVANTPQQKVIVENGSYIKNAIIGIEASNNALAEISNSHFAENGVASIVFSDISDPNYMGKIINNTFTSTNTLPIPSTPHPYCGIIARNVSHLNIGELNNANSINHFDGMFTGIYINSTQPVNYAGIGIYNASFQNIHAPNTAVWPVTTQESIIIDNTYTTPKGAGVYSNFGASPTTYALVDIQNDMLPTNANFINCDKAIVCIGNALIAKRQHTENCLLGIMCSSPYSRNYTIEENTLFNAHLGIELFGRHKSSFINKNTITSNFGIMAQGAPVMFRAPIGIKVQFSEQSILTQYDHVITNNNVNIRNIAGIGINAMYGDGRMLTESNDITFSTNSAIQGNGYKVPALFGILSDGCIGSTYSDNAVWGNPIGYNNTQYWQTRDTKGFYFAQGPECTITCNRTRFTREGFYVWGNNATTSDPTKVRHNKFYGNNIPWFFSDYNSPTTGTFGQVGDAATDNRNEFLYQPYSLLNPAGYKVFRFSNSPFVEKIYTDPSLLTANESGPYLSNYEYGWFNPNQGPTYQDPCSFDPVFTNVPMLTGGGGDSTNYSNALAIAQDSMEYINFPVVGGWIDKLRLYERLKADSVLRYSNADLLQFYTTYSGQAIGDIAHTEVAMQVLGDSNISQADFEARYAEALIRNMAIGSSDVWEQHVQDVNLIEMKWVRYGSDSLTNADTSLLHTLAASCPFVEGTAVYIARVLWSYYEPDAFYDDRYLCTTGQNKQAGQGDGYYNVDSFINSQIEDQLNGQPRIENNETPLVKSKIEQGEQSITIYPNPASTQITISYQSKKDGVFILYNTLGEIVMKTQLSSQNTKVHLTLLDIANGVYHYKIEFTDCLLAQGNITIQK